MNGGRPSPLGQPNWAWPACWRCSCTPTGRTWAPSTLHSTTTAAFDEESEQVALLFATHAAIAMAGAQQQQQLRDAIEFRDLIGQAKGILMERFTITADQAFQLLIQASQASNIKLRDVARQLAEEGSVANLIPPPR